MSEIISFYNKLMPNLFEFVVKQWKPRMLAAGVDHNNLERILSSIESWNQWRAVWSESGDEHMKNGDEAFENKNYVTAGAFYRRAALAYHYAHYMWFSDEAEKQETYKKSMEAFKKAAPLLSPAAHRIEVPWKNEVIPGYVRIPPNVIKPPVLFLVSGADAWKEELCSFTDFFLERGIATVSFDGPSQGELSHLNLERTNYEDAVSTLLDWIIENYPELDTERAGLTGISMGGYLAPRCASADQRFKAVCGIGGPFDFSDFEQNIPPLLKVDLSHLMGFEDWGSLCAKANDVVNLSDVIENLRSPLLIIHGALDQIIHVEHAHKIIAAAKNCEDKELKIYEDGNHVCNNYVYSYRPYAADWIAKRLYAH